MTRIPIILFLLTVPAALAFGSYTDKRDSLETQLLTAEDFEKIPVLINLIELTQRDRPSDAMTYAARAEAHLKTRPDPMQESLLLTQIGWVHYYMRDPDKAVDYSDRSEHVARTIPYPEGIARSKLLKGRLLRENGDYDLAVTALDSALAYEEKTGIPLLRSAILNEAGTVYRRKGESGRALEYHSRALEIIKETGDKSALSVTYNFLGIIHSVIGNFDQALKFQLLSLEVQEELNNRRGMAASITNIGIIHQQIGQYDDAMTFYERGLPIWDELGGKDERATTLNNMGAVQELLGNFEKAHSYYEEAYTTWSELGDLYSISIALDNLGSIYMYRGDFEKAIELKKETLNNYRTIGNTRGIANILINLASIYLKTMQPDSALAAAEEGLQVASGTDSWSVIRNAHETLAEIHENRGDYEQALHHHKLFKAANDTLFNSDSQTIIAELQEQYRTRQQQQQIELLQNERELQRMWFIMLTSGFFLVIMVSGLMYNRYKLKVRSHKTQEQLHLAEIEKARLHADTIEARTRLLHAENKRKSEELEAARDLQLSMLPKVLPENEFATIAAHMVTATEVGGDYYDVDLSDDGVLTFCIGDATGHGTKAGTLVTAMKGLFNLMSQEKDLIGIMHRCSAAIKKMQLPRLYMALAIARLHGNELELTGAGMPPAMIFRAGTGQVEQIELKGMPLGSVLNYPYIKKTEKLFKDDVLLLMSDGFPELTSSDGRMIGYSIAAEILAESGNKDPEEIIQHFHKTASEWNRTERASDDMTFLVLKMK